MKKESIHINNLNFYTKKLAEQKKPKARKKKEIVKIRVKIDCIENKNIEGIPE